MSEENLELEEEKEPTVEEFKKIVTDSEKEGTVVFQTFMGLMGMPVEEIIKQPTDGLLYDLNRDKATILSNISAEDQFNKWVNDYAVAVVISKLKEYYDMYQILVAKLIEEKE